MSGRMPNSFPEYFFDACTMIGRWHRVAPKFHAVDALLDRMEELAIHRALVFHSIAWLHDFRRGNAALDEAIAGRKALTPCYAVIPFASGEMAGTEAWDERLRQGSFAWRIFPKSHNFMLRDSELFAYAEARRLPVFVDIDEIDWRDLWRLCEACPRLRLVLGNAGTSSMFGIYREFRRIYEFFETFEQVAMEISFLIGFCGVEDICARFGAGRLLFGSRMPFLEPGSAVARLQYAAIDPQDRQRIAHGNLETLLAEVIR
jgi:predicted TIM-barrel fold metal-dependent hydrolase